MKAILNASQTDFAPAVTQMIKYNARKLASFTPQYRPSDRGDIEQELAIHVLRRMHDCDGARASPLTFVDRILTKRALSIIERVSAIRRDRRRERPLEEALVRPSPDEELHLRDLRLDVKEAVLRLPKELRPIAQLFMQFNEAEVVRLSGHTRGGVRHARRRIAEHFAACAFQQNPRPTTNSRGDPVNIDRRSCDVEQPNRRSAAASGGSTLNAVNSTAAGTDTAGDFLRLLHEPGKVFEVRIPRCHDRPGSTFVSVASGYFDDVDAAAKSIAALDAQGRCEGIYVTLNPCNPALLARSTNRVKERARATTTDDDILGRRWMLVDCDPRRPSGISSTDAELQAAIERARRIRDALTDLPAPIVAMSGNGAHLLYRVDLPRDDGALVERALRGLDARFGDDQVGIDVTVHNPARIVKVIGTWARKGDDLRDCGDASRPHRQSYLIEVPE
jgi:DNA-directed RNA polymerase specialized sigma24 family protein